MLRRAPAPSSQTPSSARVPRAAVGALAGLAAALLVLAALGVWSTGQTDAAARRAQTATRLSALYQRAGLGAAQERALEPLYRLEPGGAIRIQFRAASREVAGALRAIGRAGDARDRALAATLLSEHGRYLRAASDLFAAVDAGDRRMADIVDAQRVDPPLADIQDRIAAGTRRHRAGALDRLRQLRDREMLAVRATPLVFALGVGLLILLGVGLAQTFKGVRRQSRANEHHALHDALTGLPNRVLFFDRLAQLIHAGDREPAPFSVLMLDLDRFKEINDSLGHGTGDHLLQEIGPRLADALRPTDTVARLGGDEFAVLLPGAGGEGAMAAAQRIMAAMDEPFALGSLTVTSDASIGIVTFPTHGRDAETLVRHADVAMYQAKERGGGAVVYEPANDPNSPERLALVEELRHAIAAGQLELHYQPKFSTGDLRVTGAEALVRWRHPTRGMLAPADFLQLAEHTGLIRPLTLYVLRTAARQSRAWSDIGLELDVAVNLSVTSLTDDDLVADVARVLREERLPAARLELEITENMVLADPESAGQQLRRLSDMGVRLSIDDFGTGYSSLLYLRSLPVNEVKIDRSFVRNLATDDEDVAIVRSTIDLAHSLGLRVVAEGIEDAGTLAALEQLGCDYAQGYFLCRPAPPELLVEVLQRHAVKTLVPAPERHAARDLPPEEGPADC